MKWVYAIAFHGQDFVMVYHTKRKGWEMPGGRVEEGETALMAAVREFREETGQGFMPLAMTPYRDGAIYAGRLVKTSGQGEMDWELFGSLPQDLSFPEVEYLEQLDWAKDAIRGLGSGGNANQMLNTMS